MAIAFACYFAILLCAYLCDGLARWAGVRWNRRWAWGGLIVAGLIGGILGGVDGGVASTLAGMILGLVFGQIGATVVFGTNAMVAALLFGPRPAEPDKPRETPTFRNRLAILATGPLPIVFSIISAHEMFWMMNMLTSHTQYQVGYAMVDAARKEADREALAEALARSRPQIAMATHLPIRLMLRSRDEASIRGTLAYIDFLNGERPPAEIPEAWNHSVSGRVSWVLWQGDGDRPNKLADMPVEDYGAHIGNAALDRFENSLEQTWLLRHLPRKLFVRQADPAG